MIHRTELLSHIETLLKPQKFQDYCPNGLQVEGREQINTIVCGVTASQSLIERAIALQADALLVHHGYFWRGEANTITGIKQKRIKSLLLNDINLIAYHLPLDAHNQLGNNVQLADRLGIKIEGKIADTGDPAIALHGYLNEPLRLTSFLRHIEHVLKRTPLMIQALDRPIHRVGWCTGAAQGYIEQAAAMGLDAFISGEISEQTTHLARELGINYIAAGHHATERYGVMALGEYLHRLYNVNHHFVDIDNPV